MKKYTHMKLFGRRRTIILLFPLLAMSVLWYPDLWLSMYRNTSQQFSEELNLLHFRNSRSLAHYMDNIQLLIQPLATPCSRGEEIPVLVLVSSAPDHFRLRQAVRKTWGRFLPTYFVIGLSGNEVAKQLAANRDEVDLYGDMIVFDFHDHYQNSTLKTALMVYWTLGHCSHAKFLLKTDDQALINPWSLHTILNEIHDADFLIGHKHIDKLVERDQFHKEYMPHWIYQIDVVPLYLDECGYLISGKDLLKIFKKAYDTPLINLESVYFTYIIAFKSLRLNLQHDRRLSPKRPWLNIACAYWGKALTHGYTAEEMLAAWTHIEYVANRNDTKCGLINMIIDRDLFYH